MWSQSPLIQHFRPFLAHQHHPSFSLISVVLLRPERRSSTTFSSWEHAKTCGCRLVKMEKKDGWLENGPNLKMHLLHFLFEDGDFRKLAWFFLSECRPEGNKLAGTWNCTLRKHRPNEPRLFPLPNNKIHGDSYSKSPLSRFADGNLGVAPNRSLLYMEGFYRSGFFKCTYIPRIPQSEDLLLMEEILLTSWGNGSFCPLFTRFYTSQMVSRISEPSTVMDCVDIKLIEQNRFTIASTPQKVEGQFQWGNFSENPWDFPPRPEFHHFLPFFSGLHLSYEKTPLLFIILVGE